MPLTEKIEMLYHYATKIHHFYDFGNQKWLYSEEEDRVLEKPGEIWRERRKWKESICFHELLMERLFFISWFFW